MVKRVFALVFACLLLLSSCAPDNGYKEGDAIIAGDDGYLFRAYGKSTRELDDFRGLTVYTDEELRGAADPLISAAKEAEENGLCVIFVLVPSKMSVYRDKLPDGISAQYAQNRRYSQFAAALSGGAAVIDMSSCFSELKDEYPLYRTAEDGVSGYGAYFIYKYALQKIEEKTGLSLYTAQLSDYNIEKTEETSAVTREYRNMTGKTATDVDYAFTLLTSGGNSQDIAVFDTGLSASCAKFFEDTFQTVTQKSEIPDSFVNGLSVVIINETEIYKTEKPEEIKTDPDVSSAPRISVTAYPRAGRFAVFGYAEPYAKITASGGKDEVYAYCDGSGAFAAEIEFDEDTEFELYAETDGKKRSAASKTAAVYDKDAPDRNVLIGADGSLHYSLTVPDYLGTNLMSESELAALKYAIESKAEKIHEVSPDTKIIYIIAPNRMTADPDSAPPYLTKEGDASRYAQILKAFEDSEQVTFIDLKSALSEADKTAPYGLYHKTDTHWNELGAYYAYKALFEYISAGFPAAAPADLSEFTVFTKSVPGGDMVGFLGADGELLRENAVFVRRDGGFLSGAEKPLDVSDPFRETVEFTEDDPSLPSLIMYRDSFSSNLVGFVSEKVCSGIFHQMWDYPLELELYAKMKPDYIVFEYVERDILNMY